MRQCTRTVLIVDDDVDMRDSLTDVLEDEGFRVATAADGLEALAYLRENPAPCVILLDWMMPRCDGAQFRAEQRADAALAPIPVVLLTADVRGDGTKAALDAQGVLAKPVPVHRLLEVVGRFCARSTPAG